MYVRIIALPVRPEKLDEAVRAFQESAAPLFQGKQGFKGGYLVGDRKSGQTMSFSIWETEADASAMDTSGAYEKWTGTLAPCLAASSVGQQDEVLLQF